MIISATELQRKFSPRWGRSTVCEWQHDAYLQGLFYSDKTNEDDLRKSLDFFARALEKDPQFSRAWTGIAKSWLWLADAYVAPLEAYAKVRDAALCAVQ